MKINYKILSIPPYISTTWKNVVSLHVEQGSGLLILVVGLINGQRIEIPGLETPVIEGIFQAHGKYMEQESNKLTIRENGALSMLPESFMNFPLKINIGGLEGMGTLLQHNPQQTDAPPLPPEVLNRIALLCKSMSLEESANLPAAEPHCNCVHCQIARALQQGIGEQAELVPEEEVSDADLKFRTWDIMQTSDKLFIVSNPLNKEEHYNVYIGTPVGCTCGEKSCEHIQAVLRS
ncbi:MAG: hypothetical protein ACHQT8_05115 [Chlamydiales bacterium]